MRKLILIAFLTMSKGLFAQEKQSSFTFSLKEAIEYAQKNNYSIVNASKDLEIAKKKKWETTTMGLPQISGSVSYLKTFEFQKQGVAANTFNPAAPADQIIGIAFGTKHNAITSLNLSQLLFDGSYLVGLQSAKTYLKITENAIEKTNQEIKEIVIETYGNILFAEENVIVLNRNKAILEKILSDTKQIYKNGLIEEESVEQLQITLNSLQSALDNITKQKQIALNMLKLILGINLESDLKLTDKLDVLTQQNIDLNVLSLPFEVEKNIDFQIGKNIEQSKMLLVKLEKSKALPSLGAQVNFGYNTFANQFNLLNSNQKWYNFSNVGLGLNVPIFSSFGRTARTQQAKIELEKAKVQLTETAQKLKLQYQKAKSDYEYCIQKHAIAQANLKLAERIELKQEIKFREGLSTSFDFADAQKQLYAAQQEALQAMLDVINKRAALEKLIN